VKAASLGAERGNGDGRRWRKLVKAREEEERVNMWAPHVSDMGYRMRRSREEQTEGESAFARRCRGTRRPTRMVGEAAA
jgi:hypothetical protein